MGDRRPPALRGEISWYWQLRSVRFLALHELVWMRFEFVTRVRMIVQVRAELGMAVDELLIVDQSGIFREALRDLRMLIKEAISVHDRFVSHGLRNRGTCDRK